MKNLYKTFLAIALGVFSLQAHSIAINAADCTVGSGTGTYDEQAYTTGYNCWLNPAKDAAGYIVNPKVTDLPTITGDSSLTGFTEYYKDNQGGVEEGSLLNSYTTTYNGDLSGGTISYDGGDSLSCPSCFLLVKDGSTTPTWYLFDIGYWNGTDDIVMSNFWTGTGAISHVSLWGLETNVPEPGMVGLLAIGLLGMVVARRKMKI